MNERPHRLNPEVAQKSDYGHQAKDYAPNLKNIYNGIQEDLKFNPEAFGYGPTFHLKTSKGLEVQVKTYFFDKPNPRPISGDYQKRRYSYLVACDSSGEILGNRFMRTYYYATDHAGMRIETSGEITTRFRGLGLSTVIDLANREMLQDEIDHTGGSLRWGIINANARELSNLKKPKPKIPGLVVDEKPPLTPEEVRDKEEEQDRWQNLYGAMGKLGAFGSTNFDEDDFEIVLRARKVPKNLERARDIWLERDPEEGYEEPKIKNITMLSEEQKSELRDAKIQELKAFASQMKTIMEAFGK